MCQVRFWRHTSIQISFFVYLYYLTLLDNESDLYLFGIWTHSQLIHSITTTTTTQHNEKPFTEPEPCNQTNV